MVLHIRRDGDTTDSLLCTIKDEVEIAGAQSHCESSGVEQHQHCCSQAWEWCKKFFVEGAARGFALANDCMQAFTAVTDMPVGYPSVTSRFFLDQGFSEISIRRARIAWTCLTEKITDREFVMEILAHSQYESMLSSTALVHRRSS